MSVTKVKINSNFYKVVEPNKRYEEGDPTIVTEPNMAMTVKEIMEKAMKGIEPDRRNVHYMEVKDVDEVNEFYNAHFELEDIEALRVHEQALRQSYQEAVNKLKAKYGKELVKVEDHEQIVVVGNDEKNGETLEE